jgi:nitronate monooxygenase
MLPATAITELFGIRHPVLQAPMAGAATPQLASRFDDARLEAVLEIRPAVASFHFGLPDATAVGAIRDAGIRAIAAATTVAEAVRLQELGADAVIAQGSEAGGHRASFLVSGDDGPIGTLALVPQVVDAVELPVIAAGGIADGRGLAAVLALGAGAAQIGTAFLACPESGIQPAHREAVLGTPAEATTITRAFSGRPARAVHNRVSRTLAGEEVLPFPLQRSVTAPLADGDDPEQVLAMWLGQAAPLAAERPAAEVVEGLVADTGRALAGLSPRA